MSRGFVKEEDQEEAPFIPPRAALPAGAINYVTPKGYEDLIEERRLIESKLANLEIQDDKEKRHARAILSGSLNLLNERIQSARILYPADQPKDEVRFGAIVKFKFLNGRQKGALREFQLVGVDEADVKQQKIAFVAPLAVGLTGKRKGMVASVFMGGENCDLEITEIIYQQAGM